MLSLAISTACYVAVRGRGSVLGLHGGVLIIWTLISLSAAAMTPGSSYLFPWPALLVALAELFANGHGMQIANGIATCVAALVTVALLIPIAYLIGAVFLGVTAAGGIVTAVVIALIVWLLLPLLEMICNTAARWSTPVICAAAATVLAGIGTVTVRTNDAHPVSSILLYAIDADTSDAWLASRASIARADAWTRAVLTPSMQGPEWIGHLFYRPTPIIAKRVPRLPLASPAVDILSDSTTNDGAATLAARASVGGNNRARDAGDRCAGDRRGSRRSFNRHEPLSAAYARLGSTVLGTIRLRRNSEPQRACCINAKTRNSGTFPGDSHAAGCHDCPAPCERCSRPICRFNARSPVRFNSTQPMKNTAFALKDIMRFSQFRIPDNRANEIH